jgi:rhamnulokinase
MAREREAADSAVDALYLAVDLGAGSGRVMVGGLAPGELRLDEVHRFRYPMEAREGHLRWDFALILREVKAGLGAAARAARGLKRPVRSVGVDTWGVDYGLLDEQGRLLNDPICYRDDRTEGAMDEVFAFIPRDVIFARTGIQFMRFNTIFQLHAHRRQSPGFAVGAKSLMLMPDLIHHALCGRVAVEYTNATTTQLVDARTRAWDLGLIEAIGAPAELFPDIVEAGTDLGAIGEGLARELGLEGVRVVAPATHDTGSAVAGAPIGPGDAYISSGTWSLVGVELPGPLINGDVGRANFTNEGGAFGTVRFLKNVMGLWLLESCRSEWAGAGQDTAYESLLVESARRSPAGVVFPDDPRFVNPTSMQAAIAAQMSETGQTPPVDPPGFVRAILDSLALRYARVIAIIENLTGTAVNTIRVVGGGSLNQYLNQATADATRKPVVAGPVEATALGNVMVQAVAAGRFGNLTEARQHLADNVTQRRFAPRSSSELEVMRARYELIESRF